MSDSGMNSSRQGVVWWLWKERVKFWATAKTDHSIALGNRKGQGNRLHVTDEMWHQGKQRTLRQGLMHLLY